MIILPYVYTIFRACQDKFYNISHEKEFFGQYGKAYPLQPSSVTDL